MTALIVTTIAIVTTVTAFPNIVVQAQKIDSSSVTADTSSPPRQKEQEQQQQQTVHIIKDGSNSYVVHDASWVGIGTFDTTYRITGKISAVRAAENMIINTINSDFNSSSTIGYIRVQSLDKQANNSTSATSSTMSLPNPFASKEMVSQKITSEVHRVLNQLETNNNNNGMAPQDNEIEIICNFGMSLDDLACHL